MPWFQSTRPVRGATGAIFRPRGRHEEGALGRRVQRCGRGGGGRTLTGAGPTCSWGTRVRLLRHAPMRAILSVERLYPWDGIRCGRCRLFRRAIDLPRRTVPPPGLRTEVGCTVLFYRPALGLGRKGDRPWDKLRGRQLPSFVRAPGLSCRCPSASRRPGPRPGQPHLLLLLRQGRVSEKATALGTVSEVVVAFLFGCCL